MFADWKHKSVQWVLNEFQVQVMNNNVALSRSYLSGRVMHVICDNPKHLEFAEEIWTFLRSPQHYIKPNQLMFSQMLKMYSRAISLAVYRIPRREQLPGQLVYHNCKSITVRAITLVTDWIHEYQTDHDSLQGQLSTLQVRSSVILNQMIKILMLKDNVYCRHQKSWTLSALRFYVQTAIELDVIGDELRELLVNIIGIMHTLNDVKFVVEEMIIPVVGKDNFLLFNCEHGNKIIAKILGFGKSLNNGLEAQLYAFHLQMHNHQKSNSNRSNDVIVAC